MARKKEATDDRLAEAALRESDARWRALFNGLPDALLIVDDDGRVQFANAAAHVLLGRPPESLAGELFGLPLAPGGVAQVAVTANGGHAAGTAEPDCLAELRAQRVTWQGQAAWLAELRDVTRERRVERDLRDSEALHRLTLESISDAVFITDEAGAFTYICPNVNVLFGYSVAEVAALGSFARLVGGPVAAPEELRAAGEIANIERVVRDKAGREHTVLITAKRVSIGRGAALYTCRDVSARQEAQAALELSERRFRALIENSVEGVALLTAEGRFAYASPATAQILGHTPAELVGRRWARLVHPHDRERILRVGAEVLAEPGAKVSAVFRLQRRDGEWRWVQGTSHNLLHEPGVGAVVANYRDITASHAAETRLRAFAQLGRRLGAARTTEEAARVVFEIGDELFGWDACYMDEYARAENLAFSVLYIDTFDGVRRESVDPVREIEPGVLTQRILGGQPELILRAPGEGPTSEVKPFGDVARPSASLMFAPVRYGDEVRAVLSFQSYTHYAYTQDDLDTLMALAEHCGGAFDRLRAEAAVRRNNQELLILNQIGRELSALAEPAETLRRIHGLLGQLMDNRNLFVALHDPERSLNSFPLYTMDGQPRAAAERPFANGITEHVLRTRKALLTGAVDATVAELGLNPVGRPAKSLLAVPLIAGERALGVLCVQDYEKSDAFSEHQRDLLFTVALQAAVALDNARHFAAAQQEVAERRRAEAALREREQVLRQMIELLPVGVWLTDADGTVLLENPAGREIWGYRPEHERWALEHKAWDPATSQRLGGDDWPLARALQRGEATHRRELEIEAFDGLRKRVLSSVVPRRGAEGEIAGTIVVHEEVTDRRQRERELEAVAALGAALREAANRAEMLPIILAHVRDHMAADGAGIMRLLPGGQEIEVELAAGRWSAATGRRGPLDDSVTGLVVRSGEAVVTEDVNQHPLFHQPDVAGEALAAAVLPLTADQHTLGALWAMRTRPFTPPEVQFLAALANVAANALHRASQHEATRLRAEQLAAINALGRVLAETLDLEQIYAELAATSARLLPETSRIAVSLFDAGTQMVRVVRALRDGLTRVTGEEQANPIKPPGQGTQSEVIHTGQPLIVADLKAFFEARGRLDPPPSVAAGMQSGVYVPMLTKGRVIGVLHAQSQARNAFTEADAELLGLVANTAAIAIENAQLFAETERRLRYMQAMHDVDRAITSSLDLRVTLNVLLDQATTQLEVDAAEVLVLNPHLQALDHTASRGFRTKAIERSHVRLGEGLAGRVALERRPALIPNLAETTNDFTRAQLLSGEDFAAYFAMPLIAKGEVKGVLGVFHRAPLNPGHEWLEFLRTLAGQAAVAIENAGLFNRLQRSNVELSLAYDESVEAWARTLDLRAGEAPGHARRLAALAEELGRALGLNEMDVLHLRRGGLLHDIGMAGVPETILRKPGPLNDDEWALVRQHPGRAQELLAGIANLRPALEVVYAHHERWDGSGYPRGLSGEFIPLAARVFAVADVWLALQSARPWRAAWTAAEARAHLEAEAGRLFDPRVVEALLRMKDEG